MKKKILAVIMVFCMIMTIIPVGVFAEDGYSIEFSIDKSEVKPGDTIHIKAKANIEGLKHIHLSFKSLSGNANSSCFVILEKVTEGQYNGDIKVDSNFINGTYGNISIGWNGRVEDPSVMNNNNLNQIRFTVSGASDDCNPPEIKAIRLSEHNVKPGDKLKVFVEIEEDGEVADMRVNFYGAYDEFLLQEYDLKATELNNTYCAEIPITSKDRNGIYTLCDVRVVDKAGNNASFSTFSIKNNPEEIAKYQYTISDAVEDVQGPVLKSLTADKTEINSVGAITFEAKIEDDSDVSYISITFIYRDNTGKETTISPKFYKKDNNIFEAKYYFDGLIPLGKYTVSSIVMSDEHSNRTTMDTYDFSIINYVSRPAVVQFSGGDGSKEKPYIISTKEQLNEVRYNLDSNFVLSNDIIFEASDFEKDGAFYNDGMGWVPVGNLYIDWIIPDDNNPELERNEFCFRGTFEGNNHKIYGLKILGGSNNAGLFGSVENAEIDNLNMENTYVRGIKKAGGIAGFGFRSNFNNCNNEGTVIGDTLAGGITGEIYGGSITGCTNKGDISITKSNFDIDWNYCGGIAGYTQWNVIIKDCKNYGNIISSSYSAGGIIGTHNCDGDVGNCIISRCANYGKVIGYEYVGGIGGELSSQGTEKKIIQCVNKGTISTETGYAGGIAGCLIDFDIIDCYNAGSINVCEGLKAGGIVGFDYMFENFPNIKGNISNCYNSGAIISNDKLGTGIMAFQNNSSISNCYFLNNVDNGVGNNLNETEVTVLTDQQMKDKAVFKDFDFNTTWKFINEQSYPALAWEAGTTKGDILPGGWSTPASPADPLKSAKENAIKNIKEYISLSDYEDTEVAEIKEILQNAEKLIEEAKNIDEIKAIEEAAKTEINKLETSEEMALIRNIENIKFKARSKLTKLNGKHAIKITWDLPEKIDFDGFEIYRSNDKNKGFGIEPIFVAKHQKYINNKGLKRGKVYYYKVRAFKYINDEKVYTQYSYKAIRAVK